MIENPEVLLPENQEMPCPTCKELVKAGPFGKRTANCPHCGIALHFDTGRIIESLSTALMALGGLPDGYCFCFGHNCNPNKPDHEHTGECREAREALRNAGVK